MLYYFMLRDHNKRCILSCRWRCFVLSVQAAWLLFCRLTLPPVIPCWTIFPPIWRLSYSWLTALLINWQITILNDDMARQSICASTSVCASVCLEIWIELWCDGGCTSYTDSIFVIIIILLYYWCGFYIVNWVHGIV